MDMPWIHSPNPRLHLHTMTCSHQQFAAERSQEKLAWKSRSEEPSTLVRYGRRSFRKIAPFCQKSGHPTNPPIVDKADSPPPPISIQPKTTRNKNVWPWVKIQILPLPTKMGSQNGFDNHSHVRTWTGPSVVKRTYPSATRQPRRPATAPNAVYPRGTRSPGNGVQQTNKQTSKQAKTITNQQKLAWNAKSRISWKATNKMRREELASTWHSHHSQAHESGNVQKHSTNGHCQHSMPDVTW